MTVATQTLEGQRLQNAAPDLLKAVQAFTDVMSRFGEWEDARCFYYNGTTASELEEPIRLARAALAKAGAA